MIRRAAPDPVLSEVVRRRLDLLLAEAPARRGIPLPERSSTGDGPPARTTEPDPPAALPASVGRGGLSSVVVQKVWEFARSHLVAVAVIVLTGCLWTGYHVIQARSSPITPSPTAPGPPSVLAEASASGSPTPVVVRVHVIGAVLSPGVVTLPEGSRVADAIAAAGGLTTVADPGELNLAAVVADGSQVVIGRKGKPQGELRPGEGSGGGADSGAKLSLNAATAAELEALPGIGPVTAKAIVDFRESHGRFTSISELGEVDGIGPKTQARLEDLVRL